MKFVKSILVFVVAVFMHTKTFAAEPRNLLSLKQNFVLETKQIVIPGFPEAFNPSIVSWQGRFLMSFRTYDPLTRSSDAIYLVWLDGNFKPVSEPTLLKREGEVCCLPSKAQDPRLIVVHGDIYIVYSNQYPEPNPVSRMVVGLVEEDYNKGFKVTFPCPLIHFYGQISGRKEKNWVPFAYENSIYLAYSLQPHRIFMPILELNSCKPLVSTIGTIKWDWGNLAGGTPALKIGDVYLAFFHSNKALATVQSEGKVMNHYFMGAYTFEADFPFAITGVSAHPIVARTFYEGEMYENNTWKPLRVVFPGGFVFDDNFIWVVYGRQDHEAWVVKLDKAKLLDSLLPVNMIKMSMP